MEPVVHSQLLNNRVREYLAESYQKGIKIILKHPKQITPLVNSGVLIPIKNSETYLIDTLWYSYPFLTPSAKKLLHTIGKQFQYKVKNTDLENTRIIVSSLLRTTSSIKRLRRKNRNAVRYSAHLHGTTFDITYESFDQSKLISRAELESLKEILANVLFELKSKNKCWVTFERAQNCFHIVSR